MSGAGLVHVGELLARDPLVAAARRRWSHERIRREYVLFLAGARGPLTEAEYTLAFGPYRQPSDGDLDEMLARECERTGGAA